MAIRKIAKLRFEGGVAITRFGLLASLETASRSDQMSALKEGNSRQPTLDIRLKGKAKGNLWSRLPKFFSQKGTFLATGGNHECLCLSDYGAGGWAGS
jgi:hypothetical protein